MMEWIVTSSALILIVIALRGLLKGKISLKLQYGLWALVLIRLLIPFSIVDSALSVVNILDEFRSQPVIQKADDAVADYESAYQNVVQRYESSGTDYSDLNIRQEVQQELFDRTYEKIEYEYAQAGTVVPEVQIQTEAQQQVEVISLTAVISEAIPYLWIGGMVILAVVLIVSNLNFAWKLYKSRNALDIPGVPLNVYLTDYVATPCLFGVGRSDIYLTQEVMTDSKMRGHVLAHEMSHYRQGDHIWSVLRCLCLVLHWYNPLVWVAAVLSKQDAELACDEATIHVLGENERVAYGRTLIGMTCIRRDPNSLMLAATTMLGTKKTLKDRIALIAKKPKTALYTLIACILVAAIAVGCTFTGAPTEPTEPTKPDDAVWEQLNVAVNTVKSAESCHFSFYLIPENPSEVDLDGISPANEGWVYGDNFYLGYTEPSRLYYDGTLYVRMSDDTWLVDRYPDDDEYGIDVPLPSGNSYTMTWTQTEEYLDVVLQSKEDDNERLLYRMDAEGKLLWYSDSFPGSVIDADGVQTPAELYTVYVFYDTAPADVREKVETTAAQILSTMVEWDGKPNTELSNSVINWAIPNYPQLSYDEYFSKTRYYYYAGAGENWAQLYYWGGWDNGKDECNVWTSEGKIFAGDSIEGSYVQVGDETYDDIQIICCDELWIYAIEDQTELFRINYNGEDRQTLYADEIQKILPQTKSYGHVRDGCVLFFVTEAGSGYNIYRLYLPDMTLDLLYTTEDMPFLYEPYSNFEITWSCPVKEVVDDVYEIDYYYNCLTGELLERPVHGDRSWGNSTWAWWEDQPAEQNSEITKFQALLNSNNGNWYWRTIGCTFEKPEDISLYYLFYNGLPTNERQDRNTYTQSEVAFLKDLALKTWRDEAPWVNALKMPRQYINDVLKDYLGVTLNDVAIPEEWTYFAETDSYYYIRSDAYGVTGQIVTDVQTSDDGLVYVFWTTTNHVADTRNEDEIRFLDKPNMLAVLQEKADGSYLVLSNMPYGPQNNSLSNAELAEFTDLLAWSGGNETDETMWYNYAIKSIYENVADINLFELFYSAPTEELTQDDITYLKSIGENPDTDPMVHKYSISMMNDVLQRYFGISFDECKGVGLENMIYNPAGECYYHRHGDFRSGSLMVTGGERLADGSVRIHYTNSLLVPGETVAVTITLIPADGGYQIISNVLDAQ